MRLSKKHNIISLLKEKHPGYTNFRLYVHLCTLVGILVFLVLFIFEPFQIGNSKIYGNIYLSAFVYAGGSFLTLLINGIWIHFFPKLFHPQSWNLGKDILFAVCQIGCIAFTSYIINSHYNVPTSFFKMFYYVFAVSIFPYLIMTFSLHSYLLKQHLRDAAKMNVNLEQNISNISEKKDSDNDAFSSTLQIHQLKTPITLSELLYIESQGNNLILNYTKNNILNTISVRGTIKEVMDKNAHSSFLFRSHRAFVINTVNILSVSGNAAGYLLRMHPELPEIPVARSKVNELKQLISQ